MNWPGDEIKAAQACNPLLLRQLREKHGWSQANLAKAAGYSLRLVSKLESGESVSIQTIEDIAEALSSKDLTVSATDLFSDPVSLAKQYFDALYTHQKKSFPVVRHFLDPDIEFRMPGDPNLIPFAGIYRGFTEVERLFELFFSVLEVPVGHDHRTWFSYSVSINDVHVWGKSWMHPIGNPFVEPMTISHLMRIRSGKLILLDNNFDTLRASALFEPVP